MDNENVKARIRTPEEILEDSWETNNLEGVVKSKVIAAMFTYAEQTVIRTRNELEAWKQNHGVLYKSWCESGDKIEELLQENKRLKEELEVRKVVEDSVISGNEVKRYEKAIQSLQQEAQINESKMKADDLAAKEWEKSLQDDVVKELEIADATLKKDGYKEWGYVRLAVASAIKEINKLKEENEQLFKDERILLQTIANLKANDRKVE